MNEVAYTIEPVVRSLELLCVMNEVAYTIEPAVPHSLMCPPDTPDTKKPAEKLLCAHFASFSQVLLREAPSGVARVAGGSP